MNVRAKLVGILSIPFLFLCQGCIVNVSGWSSGPRIWTESVTEQISVDPAGISALVVRTHNGAITFTGDSAAGGIQITATKKGGGHSLADAEAALNAVDVYAEPTVGGTTRIGWRWRELKQASWSAQVSFDVTGPSRISVDGETHNGRVRMVGVEGDVRVVTHNGRIDVESVGGKLYAETHNGGISATYAGRDVTIRSHNGEVVADLAGCQSVDARVETHNGAVDLVLGDGVSGRLDALTHNGSIRCDVPVTDSRITRQRLTGTIGTGEGNLDVSTHNGSIRLKKSAG